MGWLEAPHLAGGQNGSASAQPRVFLTLTFSQPVLSVSPADIQVNLTETHSARAQQRHQPTGVHILLPSGDWLTLLDSTRQDKRDAVPALRCATSRNFGTQQQLWYAGICSPLLLL